MVERRGRLAPAEAELALDEVHPTRDGERAAADGERHGQAGREAARRAVLAGGSTARPESSRFTIF